MPDKTITAADVEHRTDPPLTTAGEAKAFVPDSPISLQAELDTPVRVELMFESGYSCRPWQQV